MNQSGCSMEAKCENIYHNWMIKYVLQDRPIQVNAHSYRSGGVSSAAFSADASAMFTAGYDGTIACFRWKYVQVSSVLF